jgi:hypothetical protein
MAPQFFALITSILSPLLNEFSPDRLFANLGENTTLQALGWIFLGVGAGIAAVGAFMTLRAAKNHDARMDAIVRVLVVAIMLFFAPYFVRASRDAWEQAQRDTGLKPASIAWRCLAMAARMPEISDILQVNLGAIAQNNTAVEDEEVRVIGETLDRAGNGAWGQILAFFKAMEVRAKNKVVDTLSIMTIATKIAGALIMGTIKLVIVAVYFLILDIAMFFIVIAACFMQILQYFLIVMMNLMLPAFIGCFALPGDNPFRSAARNFCVHLLAVTMWPLAWMVGHVGTIALFNAACSSMTTANVGQFAGIDYSTILTDPSNLVANSAGLAADTAQAVARAVSGSIMGLLFSLVGIIMLVIWELYVVVKLPFTLNNLLLSGADMVGQVASQSMVGAAQQLGSGAGAIGKEMQMAKVAAIAATGGAAAPAVAAGAAVGAAGSAAGAAGGGAMGMLKAAGGAGLLSGIGGLMQGGIGGAVSGVGIGRVAQQSADMRNETNTAQNLASVAQALAQTVKKPGKN